MSRDRKSTSAISMLKTFWRQGNYIIIFVCILVAYLFINGGSTNWAGITNIFLHSAILGTIALGMGLIILTGDIDLSVGSSFVFVGGFSVLFYNAYGSAWLALLCSVILGIFCGLINGLLVGKLKMPSFIVTLATMLIFRSISQYTMNEINETRYRVDASKASYKAMFDFGNGTFLTISNLAWMFLIISIIIIYISKSTKFGKKIYAIGSNEKASKLAGINVEWTRVIVYVISGALVGIAAFLKIAKDASFDPATSGGNFELYAIAAVVIGGISMVGGKGSITGIIFGTMSFTLIDKIVTALGMNALLNDTVKGMILLVAVGLQLLRRNSNK
jgi:ribose transport system permease protein